jgi:hypothetical protein
MRDHLSHLSGTQIAINTNHPREDFWLHSFVFRLQHCAFSSCHKTEAIMETASGKGMVSVAWM